MHLVCLVFFAATYNFWFTTVHIVEFVDWTTCTNTRLSTVKPTISLITLCHKVPRCYHREQLLMAFESSWVL